MLAQDRRRFITAQVAEQAAVSTVELARRMRVSVETVRRDLIDLEKQGALRRVYGGAVSINRRQTAEPPFQTRLIQSAEAKAVIGQIASTLVQPGQFVFVDSGTTCAAVAKAMAGSFCGTIATQSLLVADALAEASLIEVIMAPGKLRHGEWSVTGAATARFLAAMHFDVAFISCGGVDAGAGITDFNFDDVSIKQRVAQHANEVNVVADASKHGVVGSFAVMPWTDFHGLITDVEPPRGISSEASRSNVTIHQYAEYRQHLPSVHTNKSKEPENETTVTVSAGSENEEGR